MAAGAPRRSSPTTLSTAPAAEPLRLPLLATAPARYRHQRGPTREDRPRASRRCYVDADTTRQPAGASCTTSVILRNQNRAPSAAFTLTLLTRMHRAAQRLRVARTPRASRSSTSGTSTASRCRRTRGPRGRRRRTVAPGPPHLQARGLRPRRPAGHTRHADLHNAEHVMTRFAERGAAPSFRPAHDHHADAGLRHGHAHARGRQIRTTRAASASASPPSSSPRACSTRRSTSCRRAGPAPGPAAYPAVVHVGSAQRRLPDRRARCTELQRRRLRERRPVDDAGARQRRRDAELTGATTCSRAAARRYDLNDDNFLWVRASRRRPRPPAHAGRAVEAENVTLNFPARRSSPALRDLQHRQQGHHRHERRVEPVQPGRHHRPLHARPRPAAPTYDSDKGQIEPDTSRSNPHAAHARVSVEALDQLRERAEGRGQLLRRLRAVARGRPAGRDGVHGERRRLPVQRQQRLQHAPPSPATWSSPTARRTINGNASFYGVIYHANVAELRATMLINTEAATSRSSARS